jgi:hypothetical protein
MLKKRVEVSCAPKRGRSRCSGLDIGSEAWPNIKGYSRGLFGKGSCHAGFGRRQHTDYKLNCLAWQIQFAQALLATNPRGSLAILAATEIAVFQRLWELAADQDRIAPVRRPSVQFGGAASISESIESFRTPVSEVL